MDDVKWIMNPKRGWGFVAPSGRALLHGTGKERTKGEGRDSLPSGRDHPSSWQRNLGFEEENLCVRLFFQHHHQRFVLRLRHATFRARIYIEIDTK